MEKNKKEKDKSGALIPAESDIELLDEAVLFERVTAIIENRKYRAYAHANHENTLM